MAMIPLKQTITVHPPAADSSDPWNPSPTPEPFTLKCRYQENVERVRNQHGDEVVSSAQIFLDKYAPVTVNHDFSYTDESGLTTRYKPHTVARKRWLNGKAILTVVYV
jgi:hypothetical protein